MSASAEFWGDSSEDNDPVNGMFDDHHIPSFNASRSGGAPSNSVVLPPPVVFKDRKTRSSNSIENLLVKRMAPGHDTEAQHSSPKRDKGVRYLTSWEARAKYEVSLDGDVKRVQTGEVIDTKEIVKRYAASEKAKAGNTIIGAAHWGANPRAAGSSTNDQFFPVMDEWKGALIWVALVDKGETSSRVRFYSHVCKVYKFHHSSFGAGKSVAGAGEWVIEKGKLLRVSANSGHYRPDLNLFTQAMRWMVMSCTDETQVLMYDQNEERWVHRTAREFFDNPGGNGRYKVHPDA